MKKTVARRIFTNTLYNYIGSAGTAALSFAALLYLTRNLTIEQFGSYNLILSTQVFFTLLISMGLPSIILRFMPECIVKNDFRAARRILLHGCAALFGAGMISIIAGAVFQHTLYGFSDKLPFLKYIFAASLLGLLRAEVRLFEAAFCAFLDEGYRVFLEVAGAALKLLLFSIFIKAGFDVSGIVITVAFVDIFLIIVYYLKILRSLESETTGHAIISRDRMISYGFKEYCAKLMFFLCDSRIEAYFLAIFLGPVPTGLFFFVISITSMITEYMPGSIMQSSSQVVFARQFSKNSNREELKYLFSLNNKLKAFFVFPAFAGFALLSGTAVPLFSAAYSESAKFFPLMLAFMLFYVFLIPLRNIALTLEKSEITIISSIVIFYKVPAAIFFIKNYGIAGAIFSSGTSLFLYYMIHLRLIKRLLNVSYPWKAFLKIFINTLIVSLLLIALRPQITGKFALGAVITISATVYFGISFLNKAFSDYDRLILNKPFFVQLWNF